MFLHNARLSGGYGPTVGLIIQGLTDLPQTDQSTTYPDNTLASRSYKYAPMFSHQKDVPLDTAGADSSDPHSSPSNCHCYQGTRSKVAHTATAHCGCTWELSVEITQCSQMLIMRDFKVCVCGGGDFLLQTLSICQDGTWGAIWNYLHGLCKASRIISAPSRKEWETQYIPLGSWNKCKNRFIEFTS